MLLVNRQIMRYGRVAFCFWLVIGAALGETPQGDFKNRDEVQCSPIAVDYATVHGFPGILQHGVSDYMKNGTAIPVVRFVNSGTSAVSSVALVLEYFDKSGEIVVRIPMIASVRDKPAVPFPTQELQMLESVVDVGKDAVLAPTFVGVTLRSCPVRASLSYAQISYVDVRTVTLMSPDWRVDAIPKSIPEIPKELLRTIPFPFETTVSVTIDRTGKVADVSGLQTNQESSSFVWTDSFLRKWEFYPAVVGGKPVRSVRRFTLTAYLAASPRIPVPESDGLALVRLIRGADSSDPEKIGVYYGDAAENTGFAPSVDTSGRIIGSK